MVSMLSNLDKFSAVVPATYLVYVGASPVQVIVSFLFCACAVRAIMATTAVRIIFFIMYWLIGLWV